MPIRRSEEEKARIRGKHNATDELKERGIIYNYLMDVKSNFNIDSYEESVLTFEHLTLYRNKVTGKRVIKTRFNDYYHLID
jgi:hypothetical protein